MCDYQNRSKSQSDLLEYSYEYLEIFYWVLQIESLSFDQEPLNLLHNSQMPDVCMSENLDMNILTIVQY